MQKATFRLGILVASISFIAWMYGYINISYGYYWRDFWFHVVLYSLPVMMVTFSFWIMFHPTLWRKILGGILFLISMSIWILYLLLAISAFRIH